MSRWRTFDGELLLDLVDSSQYLGVQEAASHRNESQRMRRHGIAQAELTSSRLSASSALKLVGTRCAPAMEL